MKKEKQMNDEVKKGFYKSAKVTSISDNNGKVHRSFDDTEISTDEENYVVAREMTINKSVIKVHSVFPIDAKSTATEKILSMIDLDLEKKIKKIS
ncbi:MAG: hypothetical protein R3Y63_15715 [Eubacteriales bacterium]